MNNHCFSIAHTVLSLNVASEKKIDEWYNFHRLGTYVAAVPDM